MHIIVVGLDHTTAPIALREQLACSPCEIPQVLEAARRTVQESVLLSTCNRLELYALCSEADEGRTALLGVLSETRQVELATLQAHSYGFADGEAVEHLFEVACGLHSLVPGEPQIQGQVAEALELAQGGNFAGPIMSALFRAALVAGKRARSETGISRSAASVSQVAVQLARQLFPRLNEACVLLIGSGQMSELALSDGSKLLADQYVFACGPWLGKIFPEVIGKLIHPTRQEIFFFGVPAGDPRFVEPSMPTWIDHGPTHYFYGIPGNEWRGFKVADDNRGPTFDPTSGDRTPSAAAIRPRLRVRYSTVRPHWPSPL